MEKDRIQRGDIAYLEYEGWIVLPDGREELFDTTNEGLAKTHEIHEERKVYKEVPVIVGADRLFKGLDDSLTGAEVGVEAEVKIPPEKGVGERDPKLVELHSIREFIRKKIEPKVGMEVTLDNKVGTITAVTAGRVRVDFNNPLAGKTLRIKYKATKKANSTEEKVRGIIDMDYGFGEDFQIKASEEEADIVLPDVCKYDEKWFKAKYKVTSDLREFANLKTIRFVEEYKKREEKVEEAPVEAEADEEAPREEIPEKIEQESKAQH